MSGLLVSLALLCFWTSHAQSPDRELGRATRVVPAAAASGKRVALVIGVWDYEHVGRLVAPQNDIAAMSSVLESAGWEVHVLANPTSRTSIQDAVTAVGKAAGAGSTVMVYYAGHAAQQDNTNHLFPAGVEGENCYTYEHETVRVGWILAELHKWQVKAKVLVLDACRNNPFPACDRSTGNLIGEEGYTPDGTLLAFSTRKNATASDGLSGSSPYTTALSRYLGTPGLELTVALALTTRDTKAATGGKQEPWYRSGLDGSMVITPEPSTGDPTVVQTEPGTLVITVESGQGDVVIDGVLSWSAGEEFETRKVPARPGTRRVRVGDEERVVTVRPGATLSLEFEGEDTGPQEAGGGLYPMVRIEAGTFRMGSESGYDWERPVRTVTISRPYLLGESEVTQGLWESVMGHNPSHFSGCGASCPVEDVSWLDVVTFANALSFRAGLSPCYEISGDAVSWPEGLSCEGYRLPTEAEWEYAAGGGEVHRYSGSDTVGAVGWYQENSDGRTHAVGEKAPNGWGLYDMSGNVWEWTWDWYQASYGGWSSRDPTGPRRGSARVIRGGSWGDTADGLRVSGRDGDTPGFRDSYLGVRLARSL